MSPRLRRYTAQRNKPDSNLFITMEQLDEWFLTFYRAFLQDIATRIKLLKTEKDMISAFTEKQLKALLAQLDQRTFVGFRDYCLMILLLDSGLRINEALG